jgi:hypothetical protein
MRPVAEEPVSFEKVDPSGKRVVETHPAYAQISASRVSGNRELYQSEFSHQHFISITLRHSELHRSLSRDWPFTRKEVVQVDMSESQWATFISSLNSGSGTPCTLSSIQEERVPPIKRVTSTTDKFREESRVTLQQSLVRLERLKMMIEEAKLTKSRQSELLSEVGQIKRSLTSSIEFVASQFDEHVEETKEKAKVELEAYLSNHIHQVGLEQLNLIPNLRSENELEIKSVGPDSDVGSVGGEPDTHTPQSK